MASMGLGGSGAEQDMNIIIITWHHVANFNGLLLPRKPQLPTANCQLLRCHRSTNPSMQLSGVLVGGRPLLLISYI